MKWRLIVDVGLNDVEELELMENENTFVVYQEKFNGKKLYWIVRIDISDKDKMIEYLRGIEVHKAFVVTSRNPRSSEIETWKPFNSPDPECFNQAFNKYYGPFKNKELIAPMDVVSESDDELDRYMRVARAIEGVVSVERNGNEVIVGIA